MGQLEQLPITHSGNKQPQTQGKHFNYKVKMRFESIMPRTFAGMWLGEDCSTKVIRKPVEGHSQ